LAAPQAQPAAAKLPAHEEYWQETARRVAEKNQKTTSDGEAA